MRPSDVPAALNSTLTRPSSGPFSKMSTLSVDFAFPLAVARKAEPLESIALPLVRAPGAKDVAGTQNWG